MAVPNLRLCGATLNQIYRRLFDCYGPQHWWPAESLIELIVGAVLTQNTAWANVEKALENLKSADKLELEALLALTREQLARLIHPSGFYNIKAKRLTNLCRFLQQQGGEEQLHEIATDPLRDQLLSVNGVGRETADDILLYGYHRPVFVIDAYTRRIFSRLGLIRGEEGYDLFRRAIERALGPDVELFAEYHALIVRHAKVRCGTRPRCEGCCLAELCMGKPA